MSHDYSDANLAEMLDFAIAIGTLSKTLEEYFETTTQAMQILAESNADDKHEEFKEEFDKDIKVLKPLSEQLQSYTDYLNNQLGPILEERGLISR